MKARLPQGYGGGPQNMQEDMARVQEECEAKEYEIQAGGGAVTVKINGKSEILSIDISPDIVDPDDIETLSDVITAAVNQAIKTVTDNTNAEMAKVTGGMAGMGGMGGLGGLGGMF